MLHVSLNQEREVTDVRPDVFDTADYSLRNVIMKDRSFDKLFKVKEVVYMNLFIYVNYVLNLLLQRPVCYLKCS